MLCALSLLGVTGISAFAFTRYFDLTDEGLMLHLLMFGSESPFVTTFHILFHPVGTVFGHSLLLYRILHLLLVLLAAAAGSYVLWRHGQDEAGASAADGFSFTALGAGVAVAFAFPGHPTLWYTGVTFIGATLWAAGILGAASPGTGRHRSAWAFLGAAGAFLAYTGKFPSGALMGLMGMAILPLLMRLWRTRQRRPVTVYAVAVVLLIGGWTLVHLTYFLDALEALQAALRSSHSHWMSRLPDAKESGKLLLLTAAFGSLIRAALASPALAASAAITCVLLFGGAWALQPRMLGCLAFSACLGGLLATLAATARGRHRHRHRHWPVIALLTFSVVASTLGTGNQLLEMFGWGALPLAALVPYSLWQGLRRRRLAFPLLLAWVAGLCLFAAVRLNVARSYRSGAWRANTAACDNPLFHGVRMLPDVAALCDAVPQALDDLGFAPRHDRVLAYPDLPGLAAAAGARTYGAAWLFTRYPSIDAYNLPYMRNTPMEAPARLWMVLGDDLSPALRAHVDGKFEPAAGFAEVPVGSVRHARNRETYEIRVVGPFVPAE